MIDRTRPCGQCVASGPDECPYAYLLDDAERREVLARMGSPRRGPGARSEAAGVGREGG
ncbi:MAG: hypothetical protein ACYCXA_12465 [Actinomycetes bacterium]